MPANSSPEERFCTKFSPATFVAYINTSIAMSEAVETELKSALGDLYDHVKGNNEKKINVVVEFDNADVDETLYVGKPDRVLDRRLWRQSKFFTEIKRAVVTVKRNSVKLILHSEEGVARTAKTFEPQELDTFNRYILLHLVPYIKVMWERAIKDDNAAKLARMVEEVVMDKLGGLRERRTEPANG